MSTFSGLNAASTALWANQRSLDVAGQNIANVNTEGYSRQRAELRAMGGSAVPALYSVSTGIGEGVSADEVTRIRDSFLEARGHLEHSRAGALTVQTDTLAFVEQAFREPGDTGVQSLLSEMWAGWDDVTNAPKDLPARSQLLQRMSTLVDGLHFTQSTLDAEWNSTRSDMEVLVQEVNTSAGTVADLNVAIQNAVNSGLPANELKDRRDVLVMKLADSVGATVRRDDLGSVTVSVGGINLVSGGRATQLAVTGTIDVNTAASDPPRLVTAAGFTVSPGGRVSGQISALSTIIPGQRAGLDAVANELATSLNAAHALGFDLDGNAGGPLLGSTAGPVTASTLTLLVTDPRGVAASAVAPSAAGPSLDSSNADAIAQLRLSITGADAKYRQLIVDLGVQSAVTARNLDIQQVITTQVDASRESVAGVNLDEEMTNMLSFQHAYAAAGRLVTAIDETLDILINRTGLVGR